MIYSQIHRQNKNIYKGGWMDGRVMDRIIITSESENVIGVNFPREYMLILLVKFVQIICRQVSPFVGRVAQSVQRLPTGWTVRGSNPGGARFSAPIQTGPEAHPASCTMGTGSSPGVRCCRGVTMTPHPLLVQRSKIEQSYTSTFPKGLRGL